MKKYSLILVVLFVASFFYSCKQDVSNTEKNPELRVQKMMKALDDLHTMKGNSQNIIINEASLDRLFVDLNKYRNGIKTNYLILQNRDLTEAEKELTEAILSEDKKLKTNFKEIQGLDFEEAIPIMSLLVDKAKALNKVLSSLKQKHTSNS